ncbi:hypothetical protein AAG570_004200 [Ranatra chinensis]|uniref:Reverse transcriptase n=1 Tax=Ranatra chinensis TaxID=642074 RepID=A0ABD0Y335_9HEMI
MQIISGHGNFAGKLAGFGLRDEGNCTCGVAETVGHVLLECGKYGDIRGEYVRKMVGLELNKMVGIKFCFIFHRNIREKGVGGVERWAIIRYCSWKWLSTTTDRNSF